ncbi:MAG: stage III sporulation protein AF [Limnochordia bacterium]|jgi:stage III sporulation protein AF
MIDWLYNLLLLIILLVFLESLLPQDQIRGFVRVVIGLVLIAAVLNPLFGLLGVGWDWNLPALGEGELDVDYLQAGQALTQRAQSRLAADYAAQLDAQTAQLLLELPQVEGASVTSSLEGREIREVQVEIWGPTQDGLVAPVVVEVGRKGEASALTEQVEKLLVQYYGIDPGRIQIEYRRDGDGLAR